MQSHCFVMRLKPGKVDGYIDIHKKGHVWPEVLENIRDAGFSKMKIYVLDHVAIVYAECPDLKASMAKLGKRKIQHEWNEATAVFMDTQPAFDPEEVVQTLECVFDFEDGKQR